MEAVVCTDWHLDLLGGIFKDNPEKGIKLQIKDIEKPFDYALSKGIKNMIIPGDLGQTEDLSSLAKFHLLELLLKYDGLLNVHIIPGNHDYNRVGTHSLKLFELLCIKQKFTTINFYTEPTKVIIAKEKFNFVPFPHKKLLPGFINVAHIEPADFVRDNGRLVKDGQVVAKGISLINGHLHKYQAKKNIVLPGTLYQCNFGEKGPKGFCHVRVKDGKLSHRFVEVQPSFTFTTINIETQDDWLKIPKGETEFVRIYVKSTMTIPDEIQNYQNVLQFSGKIQETVGEDGDITSATGLDGDDSVKLVEDDDDELQNYLKTVFSYNKYQIKRTMQIRNYARSKVSIENI